MGYFRLFINIITNILAFGSSLCISFVLTPYLIYHLGKDVYSFFPLANNFVNYISIIIIALNSMAARFISIEIFKNNNLRAQEYISSIFISNILLSILLLFPVVLIVCYLDFLLNIPVSALWSVKMLFGLVFSSMIVNTISSVFGVSVFAKNRLDFKAYKEIIQSIIKLSLLAFLFSIFPPSIIYLGVVTLILSLTNFLIDFFFTKKLFPMYVISISYFKFSLVKEVLMSGIWNSINSLGSILLLGMSLFLANILIGADASGELSIVQTLSGFMCSIIILIYSVFLPRITEKYANKNFNILACEVLFSQKILSYFTTTPLLLIIVFGKNFFLLWVPTEDANYLQYLSVITMIPLFVHANMWTIYGLNVTLNKQKNPSVMLIILGIANIFFVYIDHVIFEGTLTSLIVIGSAVSVIYYLFYIPLYASKQLNAKKTIFYSHIVKTFMFCIVAIIIGFSVEKNLYIDSWYTFFFYNLILGIVFFIMHILCTLNYNEKKNILNFIKVKIK